MQATKTPIMKALCLSVALMGATAVVSTLIMPDMAVAKSDKAKGKSDKAKGKSDKAKGKSDNAKGKKPTKAKKAPRSQSATTEGDDSESNGGKKPYQGGNKIAVALGVHPSELGNLNAWNSNDEADTSSGMPGRLAAFEDYVVWSETMGGAQGDIDAAQVLFGDPTCDAVNVADCYYDAAVLFPDGIPVEGDAGYDDYLAMVAANDALDFVEASGEDYDAFGPDAEMAALQDIANKDIDDSLFGAIRDWILMNAEDDASDAGGDDAAADEDEDEAGEG